VLVLSKVMCVSNLKQNIQIIHFIISDKSGEKSGRGSQGGKRLLSEDPEHDEDSNLDNNSDTNTEYQEGFGALKKQKDDDDFINKIADVVVQKISIKQGRGDDLSPQVPIIQSSEIHPLEYNNLVSKSDEADSFDDKRLLSLIPNGYKKKAKELLRIIDEQGHLITFNSKGVLFLNGSSIPNSNIFEIFPLLFKKIKPKNTPGLFELIKQLELNGMSFLIESKQKKNIEPKVDKKADEKISENFWYLG
jgi:hypothetical protein